MASLYVPVTAFNAVGESWLYFYGLGIALELILLAVIVRYAWTWPRTAPSATTVTRQADPAMTVSTRALPVDDRED